MSTGASDETSNPYEPPAADVARLEEATRRRGIGWRLFFALSLFLMIGTDLLLITIAMDQVLETVDVIDLVVYHVAIVGLLGFVYHLRLGPRLCWQLFTPLFILWCAFYEVLAPFMGLSQFGEPAVFNLGNFMIAMLFIGPYCYALMSYAFAPGSPYNHQQSA